MAELYDFTDRDGDGLRIVRGEDRGYVTVSKEAGPASVELPPGDDAVALAEAVLAAAGLTGHRVVSEADREIVERAVAASAAATMRVRAAHLIEYSPAMSRRSELAALIRALPLLPDAAEDALEAPLAAQEPDLASRVDALEADMRQAQAALRGLGKLTDSRAARRGRRI